MKKWTEFRGWTHKLWVENCDEHQAFGERPLQAKDYWDKYKYWLKREYQHQMKAENGKK
jgi:hypothetical protein